MSNKLSDLLAPNRFQEEEENPKPTLSEMATTQFAPSGPSALDKIKDYVMSQQQKDTDMHNDTNSAMHDRIKMAMNPSLQGPRLGLEGSTPAELAQAKAMIAPAMGTTNKFIQPEMTEEELLGLFQDKTKPALDAVKEVATNNATAGRAEQALANKASHWQKIKNYFNK